MSVGDAVSRLIKTWIDRGRNHNLTLLSDRSQVPYSTVYRLSKGGSDKPPIDAVIGVLSVVVDRYDRANFLEEYYPAVYEALAKKHEAEPQLLGPVTTDHPVLDHMMTSPASFLIAQQVLSKSGVSTDRIRQLYGEHGLGYIEALEIAGLLRVEDGRVRCPAEYSNWTLAGNKAQVVSAAQAWDVQTHATGCGMIETRSESVSLEGAKKIKHVLEDSLAEIRRIHQSHPGHHTYVVSLMMQLADPLLALEEMGEKQ